MVVQRSASSSKMIQLPNISKQTNKEQRKTKRKGKKNKRKGKKTRQPWHIAKSVQNSRNFKMFQEGF